MKVDFFKGDCQETISNERFGICDDENATPAYTNITDENKWIATVINNIPRVVNFTAIDHCIDIQRDNGEMDNRCDVMLSYEGNLLLVELKTKRADWKAEGLYQIEVTVKRMLIDEEEYYFSFNKRKAIVANSKHSFPGFQEYDTEMREYFKNKYKMRVQFEAEIVIN